jgi:mannosyltransferase
MALPTSLRYLAAVTLCLLVFLFVLVFRTPAELSYPPKTGPVTPQDGVPGWDPKLKQWNHDPQLDRMYFLL